MSRCSTWHIRIDLVDDGTEVSARASLIGAPASMTRLPAAGPHDECLAAGASTARLEAGGHSMSSLRAGRRALRRAQCPRLTGTTRAWVQPPCEDVWCGDIVINVNAVLVGMEFTAAGRTRQPTAGHVPACPSRRRDD